MKSPLITSDRQSVTSEQIEQCAQVVAAASRKKTREVLNKFARDGKLNSANMQTVLAAGDRIASAATEAVGMKIAEIISGRVGCLKLISLGKEVPIGPTLGTEILAEATDVFNHIDPDFKNWGCDEKEEPTEAVLPDVYELVENADCKTMFGGFGQNLDRLALTTPQIKRFFAEQADKYLREDGWAVFLFLFKVKAKKEGEKDEFFVAFASRCGDGKREVVVSRLSSDDVWDAESRYRVVVPQLTLKP